MTAIRIHELAKEIGGKSKDIIELLKNNGFEVKSHMTALTDEMETTVREAYAEVDDKPKKKAKPGVKAVKGKKEADTKKKVSVKTPVEDEGDVPESDDEPTGAKLVKKAEEIKKNLKN